MGIFLSILLAILPELIRLLLDILKKGQALTEPERLRLTKIVALTRQLDAAALKLGCGAPAAGAGTFTAAWKVSGRKRGKRAK